MLVLSRNVSQRIMIGNSIVVTVVEIQGGKVRIGIEAPPEVAIAREELLVGHGQADGKRAGLLAR